MIQMEITKEFGMSRHHGVLNIAMVKVITLPELKFPPYLNSMIMLRRIIQLQKIKWWLK